jgi:hypothetical protein
MSGYETSVESHLEVQAETSQLRKRSRDYDYDEGDDTHDSGSGDSEDLQVTLCVVHKLLEGHNSLSYIKRPCVKHTLAVRIRSF